MPQNQFSSLRVAVMSTVGVLAMSQAYAQEWRGGVGHDDHSGARGSGSGIILESTFTYDQLQEQANNDSTEDAQRIPQVVRSQSHIFHDPFDPLDPYLDYDHRYQGVFVEYSGSLSSSSDEDYYIIHASKGDVLGAAVIRAGGTTDFTVEVWHKKDSPSEGVSNSDGYSVTRRYRQNTPLPRIDVSDQNGSAAVGFVAPANGQYYVKISGDRSGSYNFKLVATRSRGELGLLYFSPVAEPIAVNTPTSITLYDSIDSMNGQRLISNASTNVTGMMTLAQAYSMSGLPANEYDTFKDEVLEVIQQNLEDLKSVDPRVTVNVNWSTLTSNPFLFSFNPTLNSYTGNYSYGMRIHLAFCGKAEDFSADPEIAGLAEGGSVGGFEGGIAWVGVEDLSDPMSTLRGFLDNTGIIPAIHKRRALATIYGNIATHEIGHVLGVWHTESSSDLDTSVMEAGASLNDLAELGENDIFEGGGSLGGGGDDVDLGFVNDHEYASGTNEPNLQGINTTRAIAAAPLVAYGYGYNHVSDTVEAAEPPAHVPHVFETIREAIEHTSPYTGQEIRVADGHAEAGFNTMGKVPYVRSSHYETLLDRRSPRIRINGGITVQEQYYDLSQMPEFGLEEAGAILGDRSPTYRRVRVPTFGTVVENPRPYYEDRGRTDVEIAYHLGSGAIINDDADYNNSIFIQNRSYSQPGAVRVQDGHVRYRNCGFLRNRRVDTNGGGGAILQIAGTLEIVDSYFRDNEAAETGGAIQSEGGDLILNRVSFRGNFAGTAGGAIYRSTQDGDGGRFEVFNSEFFENTAPSGAAIVYDDFSKTPEAGWVLHNTFVRNLGDTFTSVVHTDSLGELNLDYNIFWDNHLYDEMDPQFTGAAAASLTLGSNIVQDGSTTSPNLISPRSGELRLFGLFGSAYEALPEALPVGYPDIGELDIRRAPRTQYSSQHSETRRSYGAYESEIVYVDAADRISDTFPPDQYTTIAAAAAAVDPLGGVISIDSQGANSGFHSESLEFDESTIAIVGGWSPADPPVKLGDVSGMGDPGVMISTVTSGERHFYTATAPHLALGLSRALVTNKRPLVAADTEHQTFGGAMRVSSLSSIFVTDSVFEGNSADRGGAAYVGGHAWFRNVSFRENEASLGGALNNIWARNYNGMVFGEHEFRMLMIPLAPHLELLDSVFQSNTAYEGGGDLAFSSSKVAMDRVISHDAVSSGPGAHVYSYYGWDHSPVIPVDGSSSFTQTNSFVAEAVGESVVSLTDRYLLDPQFRSVFRIVNNVYRDSTSNGATDNYTLAINRSADPDTSHIVVSNAIFQNNTAAGNVPTSPAVDPTYSITDVMSEENVANSFMLDTVLSTQAMPVPAAYPGINSYLDYTDLYRPWFILDGADSAVDAGDSYMMPRWISRNILRAPRIIDYDGVANTGPYDPIDIGVYELGEPCPADFDGDGDIGSRDLAILLAQWTPMPPPMPDPCPCIADLNGDGVVGSSDLAIYLAADSAGCP